jgi:YHS domain-containing protein
MAQSKAAGWTSEHRGKTYYFCRDFCKMYFDKNPNHYDSGLGVGQAKGLPHPFDHFLGKPDNYLGGLNFPKSGIGSAPLA